jgi:diguanylate cyclase (GGDEF)-like protein
VSTYSRLAAGFVVLFVLWLCLPGRTPGMSRAVSELSFVIAPSAGAWKCVVAARRRDAWRRTWCLLAIAMSTWALGSAVWDVEGLRGPAPFPSPADVGWLLFPLLAIAALFALPELPRRATPAARLLLDGVAVAASMLLLARLGPLDGTVGREVHGLGHWVVLAYPCLDVLAVSVVIIALDRLRAGVRHPGVVLALGLAGACGSDLTYAMLASNGSYVPGGLLDGGWAASFLLVGFAAGRPVPAAHQPATSQHHLLPSVPAGLALLGLTVSGHLSHGLDRVMVALSIALGVALAARQHLLTAENRELHGSLEQRVADRTAELQEAREVYRHRAYTDPLTGLANRDAFNEALAAAAETESSFVGVVLLDLDGFKQVNDSFGHEAGDEVLVAVAARLRSCLRRAALGQHDVSRLGGDEFACLLRGLGSPADADKVAGRLLHAMRESVTVGGREFFLGASAGVAVAKTPLERPPGELLREADTAMYVAKDEGGNCFRTFDGGMHSAVVQRVALEADLHRALADGGITVHYQPILGLDGDRITGVEALARWQHPVRGWVSPADFIPVAERTGLIIELERQVLEQVCAAMRGWRKLVPDLKVGVNFSARHLREPGVVREVLDCLSRHDLPPSMLVAEVTESLFFADEDVVSEVLQSFHQAGVVLALDDFGTGYSSLSRLSRHPFGILKVDRSFLAEVGETAVSPTILLATLAIARGLGMDVVAEGVETQAQLDFLLEQGCPFAQGYLIARPAPAESVPHLLRPAVAAAV